jgi:excisionase family DNA binding protein
MPVTVEDAARITRIPARTIRQWIEDGRIGTVAASRPMLVRLSDVTRNGAEKVS